MTDLTKAGKDAAAAVPLISFTMSINDVFLVATFIAVAAIPFTILIRKKAKRAVPAAAAA